MSECCVQKGELKQWCLPEGGNKIVTQDGFPVTFLEFTFLTIYVFFYSITVVFCLPQAL